MIQPDSTKVKSNMSVTPIKASEVAGNIIEKLDKCFSRADVVKIAEWVHYLSTQD